MYYLRSFIAYVTAPFRFLLVWPARLIAAPRRLMGMSLELRVAVLLSVFLLLAIVTAYLAFWLSGDEPQLRLWLRPSRLALIVLVFIPIPLIAYFGLKLWLKGEVSRYPDLDAAWRAGMTALARNHLDLGSVPIFLVLGVADQRQADALMQAAHLSFIVQSVPDGRAPVYWYANDRAIFLVVTGAGCLARLVARVAEGQGGLATQAPAAPALAGARRAITETLVAGPVSARESVVPTTGLGIEPAAPSIRGTLMAPSGSGDEPAGAGTQLPSDYRLPPQDVEIESDRLHFLCQRLARARQPLCPLNGAMTVLPLPAIQNIFSANELPGCVRRDLTVLRQATQLCFPITALVSSMETEAGFAELVRRIGPERSRTTRFGKGFNVWNAPSAENLDALSSHACGAFEDWVYTLFREDGGLDRPNNPKLYALLCKIRSQLHTRLRNILTQAFSSDERPGEENEKPLLFGGCYFAATGPSDDRQAFVRSALEKLIQQEEDLQWTDPALIANDRYLRLAQLGILLNAAMVVTLIGLIVYKTFWD